MSESSKEDVLLNHIKRILQDNRFSIHPLSGHQILNNKRRTIGEIDIVATKDDKLIYIELKIIPLKKISSLYIEHLEYTLLNMKKKLNFS